jgi:hypothetical protein
MKKVLLLILLVFVSIFAQASIIEEFHALVTKKQEQIFLEKYKTSSNPSVLAYYYAVQMKQAEYAFNPIKKLSIFSKYKNLLNALVLAHPSDLNLRYIRLVIQEKSPAFLGYKDFIPTDKLILQKAIQSKTAPEPLIKFIKLNTSL